MFLMYVLNWLYESDLLWVTTGLFTSHVSHLSEKQKPSNPTFSGRRSFIVVLFLAAASQTLEH